MAEDSSSTSDFTIDVEDGLLHMRLRGRLTLQSMLELAEAVYTHEDYLPSMDAIIEVQTTDLGVSFEDLQRYAAFVSAHPKQLRGRAVLVASTPVAWGIARMYGGAQEDLPLHFERTVEAARAILRPAGS